MPIRNFHSRSVFLARCCPVIFALVLSGSTSLFGQTPVTVHNNDQPCDLSIDGSGLGTFAANASKTVALQPGSHSFVCFNSSIARAKDKGKQREILLESSATVQIRGSDEIVVQLPRLTVQAKNTYGAASKIAPSAALMTDQCRSTATKGQDLKDSISIVDGAVRSCDGVGAYLLVRSHRKNYLVPLQEIKLLVPGEDEGAQDSLFEIRPNE